jgi:hypothetical protein
MLVGTNIESTVEEVVTVTELGMVSCSVISHSLISVRSLLSQQADLLLWSLCTSPAVGREVSSLYRGGVYQYHAKKTECGRAKVIFFMPGVGSRTKLKFYYNIFNSRSAHQS